MDYCWWKHGVIYHIYPRSFFDSNNDGLGDIKGIVKKLDYLQYLGVNAIWLSPIYLSPKIDFGYDVQDYYQIDSDYGNMNDFENLLKECNLRNIKVIMDLILNHTSNKHEWFLESSSSENNNKRDWYIWCKAKNKKPANNWQSVFGGSAWEYDCTTDSFYLHSFYKEQPDLNWRNKEMADEFFKIIKFWLDKGIDGFRLDVINMIVKDKKFRNNPLIYKIPFLQKNKFNRNRPYAYKIIKKLRTLINKYENRVLIGEIYVLPPGNSKTVYKYIRNDKKRLHMAFDFSLIFKRFSAINFYNYVKKWNNKVSNVEWACHVFSNHDLGRSINRFTFRLNKEEKARLIAMFQLTIPGTPFIYYGEEIGMMSLNISKNDIKDKLGKKLWPIYSGRDKYRTPMQWNDGLNAGFTNAKPWLPVHNNYKNKNVELQMKESKSILNLYCKLIEIRKTYKSLHKGLWKPYLKGKNGILAYFRQIDNEEMLIILNFSSSAKEVHLPDSELYNLEISTNGENYEGIIKNKININPYQGYVLRRIQVE